MRSKQVLRLGSRKTTRILCEIVRVYVCRKEKNNKRKFNNPFICRCLLYISKSYKDTIIGGAF